MEDDHQLPPDYTETVELISARVSNTRVRVQLAANAHLIHLYWAIGSVLLERSKQSGWGSRVLPRLAEDLRRRFPTMKGFSATNLKYMRQLAAAWPEERSLGPQSVDQLPWGHVRTVLGVSDPERRARSIAAAVREGWARHVLEHNLRTSALERTGAQTTNFGRLLDPEGADLAQQVTRDPYVLDFLALDGDRSPLSDRPSRTPSPVHPSSTSMATTSSSTCCSSTSNSSGTWSSNSNAATSAQSTSGSSPSPSPSWMTGSGCRRTRTRWGCSSSRARATPSCGTPSARPQHRSASRVTTSCRRSSDARCRRKPNCVERSVEARTSGREGSRAVATAGRTGGASRPGRVGRVMDRAGSGPVARIGRTPRLQEGSRTRPE